MIISKIILILSKIWDALAASAENWLKFSGVLKYSSWDIYDELTFVGCFYLTILLIMFAFYKKIETASKKPPAKYVYILVCPSVISIITIVGLAIS